MVRLNRNNGDTTYFDVFYKKVDGSIFLVQCTYDKNAVSDSLIFLGRQLVDYYIDPPNNRRFWKAKRISDTLMIDGNGELNEVSEFRWEEGSNYAFVKNRNKILGDTTLHWSGKPYSAIITRSIVETMSNFLLTPDGNHNFRIDVINYLCRHLAL